MAENPYFRVATPLPRPPVRRKDGTECTGRQDAPVCANGEEDVTCTTEVYRGCPVGQTDCADNAGNPDDRCCSGSSMLGPGDNIDHEFCTQADAEFGGFSWCFSSFDANRPPLI